MLIKNNGRYFLSIFENFQTDHSLPKYNKDNKLDGNNIKMSKSQLDLIHIPDQEQNMTSEEAESGFTFAASAQGRMLVTMNSGEKALADNETFFGRICRGFEYVGSVFAWPFKKKLPEPVGVIETFEAIFASWEQVRAVQTRMEGCTALLKRAKAMRQTALVEQIQTRMKTIFYESSLLAIGQDKYLSEAMLVQFAEKCEKGLRLDWIKNFGRLIPAEIAEKKLLLDKANIFDNYVVLHYDPEGKHHLETAAEKAKRRDPILFGVIADSRNLYYVGDWKDEICDLTLDDILKTVGQDGTVIPATVEEKDIAIAK